MVKLDNKLEDMEDELDESAVGASTPKTADAETTVTDPENQAMDASFMSESIYEKLPSPKTWRHKTTS